VIDGSFLVGVHFAWAWIVGMLAAPHSWQASHTGHRIDIDGGAAFKRQQAATVIPSFGIWNLHLHIACSATHHVNTDILSTRQLKIVGYFRENDVLSHLDVRSIKSLLLISCTI
jgi:hypothetical protein